MAAVQIREQIKDPHVRIIFYTRERPSYLKSLFKQHLKVLMAPSSSIENELRAFLGRAIIHSDMERQTRIWREVFDDVRVIRFEDHAGSRNLLASFMKEVDRDLSFDISAPRNVSPDWAELELRRIKLIFGVRQLPDPDPEKRARFNEMIEAKVTAMIAAALAE
ncbi:hypothetical protein PE067_18300 [Paracoccus sp. DMF-8]|uniref:hypothetical protein n=1 Tax=Paracoccus sp. DMF-8 TaxID=3019445 RepID=UPI0023E4536A|nr:hypothetical protein [Paracoccus sp. DMF-8]MDF3607918.1 hypothetical protein [Paracoccus sp. DMF-8]